ncbi:SpoIIAA family protein [Microbulbifer thermotolerans]|uniref:STAS/SEC14 domain-containing protein n=1 Tax=Microbulbifer thermotolerans TaxID=252514 RepID=UPI0022492FB2|nr:STAS/SEC14 domain-containing protein [Microbulbifer thermotolerans]MCX2832700.1 STAS/SEC14 domain-containing protein [Microbulbifer thermotolerans]
MIDHNWHWGHKVLEVRPSGPLEEEDFRILTAQVDPVISEYGRLNGLLVDARDFAGWESFATLVCHCKFVRDHHRYIHRIAVVSDHGLLGYMPRLVDHFVSAEVRPFPSADYTRALEWLAEPG